MNKQIEEIAKVILEEPHLGGIQGFEERIAERLYTAGYRKKVEGHWYKHDKKKHGDTCYYCSACEHMALSDCMCWELTDYCPYCGAKMKGDQN